MKRFVCLFLVLIFLFTLCSCGISGNIKDEGTFYYRRSDFLYGKDSSVMAAETKDITGHADDLSYLVALYLLGPTEKALVSPFPRNAKLLSAQMDGQSIMIELSDMGRLMTDAEFSLACACLTLTCLDLTDGTQVTVTSADRSITMTQDTLLLYDGDSSTETIAEESK